MLYTWSAKIRGAYAREDTEAIDNALCCYGALYHRGWGLNAICGVWANIGFEGGYNPWRWESDDVLSENDPLIDTSRQHGYGLVQFTPSGKYLHDSRARANQFYAPNYLDKTGRPEDGYSQLFFIDKYADYYPTTTYPLSYASYKTTNASPEDCASIWMHNYERPGSYGGESLRRSAARYWYDLLSTYEVPDSPESDAKKFKIMFYLKPKWKRGL